VIRRASPETRTHWYALSCRQPRSRDPRVLAACKTSSCLRLFARRRDRFFAL